MAIGEEVSTVNTIRKNELFMKNKANFNLDKIDVSNYMTNR